MLRLSTALLFSVFLFTSAFPQDSLNIRRIAEILLARGYVNCVTAQRNYVFAGTGGDSTVEGLWVVDVSNPVHPDSVAFDTVSELWSALGIALTESLAVIASAAGQVDIYDIRDPLAPRHLSNVGQGDGLVWDVAVQGVHVYAARYSPRGMSVTNIADPVHPFVEGIADMADNPSGVCVSGDYAYVAAENGLHVVDVANPALPEAIAFVPDTGAMHVAVWDHHAYVTNYGGELAVVDLSNPRVPVLVASVLTQGYSDGVAAAYDHVFVAAAEGGLRIYDLSNPANPVLSGFYRCAIWPSKVAVSGRYAYVASDRHLEIYDCSVALGARSAFILHPFCLSQPLQSVHYDFFLSAQSG